ncbi:alpha/beta fold hydrolase [Sandaracinus amylolyticus]|uniref:alpha/beta fold hydrolase n=1 Tax=Sandaracinus amylolyticus TaxID=927083 RepID=UPI001F240E4B|nr:alpha/beta hydrolase [Sandaracinus amylolyticus]UJR80725.1 Pimeloyl-ACP methyl ester carboxylesterase [Sandaracinus amylolyticus]
MEIETPSGVVLHVRASGPVSGAGVLLLHGGGQTGASWGRTADALASRGHRVWAPDLRGHGESGRAPGGDYGIDAFVGDGCALIDALSGETSGRAPVVVGASLGGIVSLLAASERARPMRALVLVDIALRARGEGVERIVGFMRSTQDGFDSLDDARAAIARYLPHRRAAPTIDGLHRVLRRREDGRWMWHWDPLLLERLEVDAILDGARLHDAARALEVPLLLLRGGHSDVVSEELARELVSIAPRARWQDVREVGHMVAGDDNDAFTTAVLAFLDQLDQRG